MSRTQVIGRKEGYEIIASDTGVTRRKSLELEMAEENVRELTGEKRLAQLGAVASFAVAAGFIVNALVSKDASGLEAVAGGIGSGIGAVGGVKTGFLASRLKKKEQRYRRKLAKVVADEE